MAFTFPDPSVTTELTAPNGITYSWDNVDNKWNVKSFGTDSNVPVSDSPPTDVQNGALWFDSSSDFLELFLYYDPDEDPDTAVWVPASPASAQGSDSIIPFVSSFKIVNPEEFSGEDGTCYAKTVTYSDTDPDANYNGRAIVEFGFATRDLNGYGLTSVSSLNHFDYTFNPVDPADSVDVQHGVFKIKNRSGYRSFLGETDTNNPPKFSKGDTVYIRTPSLKVLDEEVKETRKSLVMCEEDLFIVRPGPDPLLAGNRDICFESPNRIAFTEEYEFLRDTNSPITIEGQEYIIVNDYGLEFPSSGRNYRWYLLSTDYDPDFESAGTLIIKTCKNLESLQENQQLQDDEIQRVEQESKARDLVLELELLYLAKQGETCDVARFCQFVPAGPPFSSGEMFSASGNVVKISSTIFESLTPGVGATLRFSGSSLTDEFSSVITDVGNPYQPATGYRIVEITIEDTVPNTISGAAGGTTFQIASCDPSVFVTKSDFNVDQKRQDDKIQIIENSINYCKVNQNFTVFPVGPLNSDFEVQFTGNGMYFTLFWDNKFEVGDEVDITTNIDEINTYTITNVGEIELGSDYGGAARDKRLYTVAEPIAHNYAMMGAVDISNCDYPYVTPEEFAEDKQLQDTEITNLQNDIIELEEEIDAIAPSVERGKWTFTAVGTVANPGQFTMYDADFGSGSPTGLFKNVKSIWFNQIDSEGTTHAFADVDDGELLEIFVDNSPEFGLYEVVGQAHDETQGATSFWVVDVNFIRTNEDTAAVDPSDLCRFKIFMAPTAGNANDFIFADFSYYAEITS